MKKIVLLLILLTNGFLTRSQSVKDHFKSGCELYDHKDYTAAVSEFDAYISVHPNDATAIFNRGLARIGLKAYYDAIADLKTSIDKGRTRYDAWFALGLCKFELRSYVEAIDCFNRAISIDPSHGRPYIYKAASLHYMDKSDDALALINKGIILEPYEMAYYFRSLIRYKLGDTAGSFEDANKATELDSNARFFFQRGFVAITEKKYDLAAKDFSLVVAHDPKDAEAWYNMGVAKINLQQFHGALSDLDKSIALNSSRSGYYYNRAICKKNLQQFENAITDLSTAADLDRKNPDIYLQRGICYYMENQFESAIDDLSKAIKYNRSNGEAYYYRALAYKELKKKNASCDDIKTAVDLNFTLAGKKLEELDCNKK